MRRIFRLSVVAVFAASAALPTGCVGSNEPTQAVGERADAVTVKAVLDGGSCSTAGVIPLARQIIEVTNCLSPGILTAVPTITNFKPGATTVAYMQKPAVDAFVAALAAKPKSTFVSNSMLRTLAQQYLLRKWYEQGKCGITAAAQVGKSNHESGLAIDTSDYSLWRSTLESKGFVWLGSGDVVHFDYKGAGTKSLSSVEIKGFQMLWNENHPEDTIDTDGDYGTETEARLAKSPAEGFAKVPGCGAPPAPKDTDGDGVADDVDNCDAVKNVDQADLDKDKAGDACDDDDDGDGVLDAADNCPRAANKDQADVDLDNKGDACEQDDDGDGIEDASDVCPAIADPSQADLDGDRLGDACDADRDGDDVPNDKDNCPDQPNDDQTDIDQDGVGDACDPDPPPEPEHDGGEGEAGASGAAGEGTAGAGGAAGVAAAIGGAGGRSVARTPGSTVASTEDAGSCAVSDVCVSPGARGEGVLASMLALVAMGMLRRERTRS